MIEAVNRTACASVLAVSPALADCGTLQPIENRSTMLYGAMFDEVDEGAAAAADNALTGSLYCWAR